MKNSIKFSMILLLSIAINSQIAFSQIMRISQSLRRGNGNYTLIIGSNDKLLKQIQRKSTGYPIFTKTQNVSMEMTTYLFKYVSTNCNKKVDTSKGDGYQVVIDLFNNNHVEKCFIMNKDLVKIYFENMILHLKKLKKNKDETTVLISELQQIIDYATLPQYAN